MIFFSVLLALIVEQMRALPLNNPVNLLLQRHIAAVERSLTSNNAVGAQIDSTTGPLWYSVLAWLAVVLPWVVGVGFLYVVLHHAHFIFAYAWSTAVIYCTLGSRQFSHPFMAIRLALRQEDIAQARALLQEWIGLNTINMSAQEVSRQTMAHGFLVGQRRVFGVFFWLIIPVFIPFGPVGAVLYRIADYLAHERKSISILHQRTFDAFCQKVFFVLNWIPARLTAFGFAMVGNFEQALYAWRNQAKYWPDSNEGIVLAAAGGALGVNLTGIVATDSEAATITLDVVGGAALCPNALDLGAGLVRRTVTLWMALLLMLTFAAWVG